MRSFTPFSAPFARAQRATEAPLTYVRVRTTYFRIYASSLFITHNIGWHSSDRKLLLLFYNDDETVSALFEVYYYCAVCARSENYDPSSFIITVGVVVAIFVILLRTRVDVGRWEWKYATG